MNKGILARLSEAIFGPALPEKIPVRVSEAIRRQENSSEILVCWAQIGAVVLFAAVYTIAPKTFPPDAPFEPVPVTLAAYALFTFLRLYLAYRQRLPAWFLALSVLIDVSVLMITIWSFHLQYNQPPALYLKAPTLLYVFIIITLRALRFDPKWVILAGALGCAGWLLLVLDALRGRDASALITHNYVEYMTSLKILIGAEVDKILSIVVVTALLGLTLIRARRLLVQAVTEQTAASELSRFFAPDVAQAIVGSEQAIKPGDGVLRHAAAMFLDLRGFTNLASMLDPKALVAVLGEYQSSVVPLVQRHRGAITTYLGDGIMITFGATRPNDSYAADALRATEELIEVLTNWAEARRAAQLAGPGIGIGVTVGTVIYGAIGDHARLEYAIIGDPVNRAAKLQNHTKQEAVSAVVSADAWTLALAQGFEPKRQFDRRTGRTVQGIAELMDVVAIR